MSIVQRADLHILSSIIKIYNSKASYLIKTFVDNCPGHVLQPYCCLHSVHMLYMLLTDCEIQFSIKEFFFCIKARIYFSEKLTNSAWNNTQNS